MNLWPAEKCRWLSGTTRKLWKTSSGNFMNKEWSEKNKEFQKLISKEATFKDGIKILLELRTCVFEQITQIVNGYPENAFYQMPFAGADGYHSKTLAYSIWHIFRIEDIVCHTLILKDAQVLDSGNWQKKIRADIITTGNELTCQQIADFSKRLDVKALYEYAKAVMESTDEFLNSVEYSALKSVFNEKDRQRVIDCGGVSSDKNTFWLVDYWCGKNMAGLLKMPFSRHWIMHVEAMQRIKDKLCKNARKGVDPIAYCGFSCNHCFLSQWCGSCRTEYKFAKTQEILGQDMKKGFEILEKTYKGKK